MSFHFLFSFWDLMSVSYLIFIGYGNTLDSIKSSFFLEGLVERRALASKAPCLGIEPGTSQKRT